MDLRGLLNGGGPWLQKHPVGETVADAGIIMLEPDAGGGGLALPTTIDLSNAVGMTYDTATFVTAQQTDGTSAERLVNICINPDAVYRILMSGGATEGTALVQNTISSASADGLDITDDAFTWTAPSWDEGSVFMTNGVNQGQLRRVTAVSGSVATISVAFDFDNAVGDTYFRVPWWPLGLGDTLQTTTLFTQADTLIAVNTGGDIKSLRLEFDGATASFLHFMLADHALGATAT